MTQPTDTDPRDRQDKEEDNDRDDRQLDSAGLAPVAMVRAPSASTDLLSGDQLERTADGSDQPVQLRETNPTRVLADPLDLEAIKARADAASPPPWSADVYRHEGSGGMEISGGRVLRQDGALLVTDHVHTAANAEFIAAARSDIPALLAERLRLHDQLAEAEKESAFLRKDLAAEREIYMRCAVVADRAVAAEAEVSRLEGVVARITELRDEWADKPVHSRVQELWGALDDILRAVLAAPTDGEQQ